MQRAYDKRMDYNILLMQLLQTYDRKNQEMLTGDTINLALMSICVFNYSISSWMSKILNKSRYHIYIYIYI